MTISCPQPLRDIEGLPDSFSPVKAIYVRQRKLTKEKNRPSSRPSPRKKRNHICGGPCPSSSSSSSPPEPSPSQSSSGGFLLVLMLPILMPLRNTQTAWAVEGEFESSWYFLSDLVTAISEINRPATTIMSDRDKGLLATDNEIPRPHSVICAERLSHNLQTGLACLQVPAPPSAPAYEIRIR